MSRPIRVLFGTETGNAEGCAEELHEAIKGLGLAAELTDMDDFDHEALAEESYVFIVTSTFGNGDPPYNAYNFMEWIKGSDAVELDGLRFSVCGLGDRSYPNFAQAGRDFDTRLEALGGERVVARVDCDVDFEVPFDQWKQQVVGWLRSNHPDVGSAAPAPVAGSPAAEPKGKGGLWGKVSGWFGKKEESLPEPAPVAPAPRSEDRPWGRDNPFPARLVAMRRLNAEGSDKETMHYTLDLTGSGFAFEGGDSFGVMPLNPPAEVEGVLQALGLSGDEPARLKDGSTRPIREVLSTRASLQKTSVELLRRVAKAAGPAQAAVEAGGDALTAYIHDRFVWDVLRDNPGARLTPQDLVETLRPIHPRLYSVANSSKVTPDQVDFVVETLRYTRHDRDCEGVASVWLADRTPIGGTVPLYLHVNKDFRLPDEGVDVLMIGPGTGVAPFRAFLQERAATGASGRNWLFFGHQHEATDYLYRDEIEGWHASGVLTRASFAWSRDQDHKVYVQDRLLAEGAEVWAWLQAGAHVFVCGDAKGMAPGVHDALVRIAQHHGGLDADTAVSFVDGLAADHRYHRDVY